MPLRLIALIVVTLAGTGAAEETAPDDLLDAIIDAQSDVERVQGTLRQTTTHADDPAETGTVYDVRYYFQLPDRYHLRYQPVDAPEEKEWFLSDGEWRVHAEQLFADEQPMVERERVDPDGWGLQRVADFMRMDRAALAEDFRLAARAATDDDRAILPAAAAVVELTPKGSIAEEIDRIVVLLDERYRTGAVVIHDSHDNRILLTVQEADYDTPIDPGIFTWNRDD